MVASTITSKTGTTPDDLRLLARLMRSTLPFPETGQGNYEVVASRKDLFHTARDGIPLVIQLASWNNSLGFFTVIVTGDEGLAWKIPTSDVDHCARMIDFAQEYQANDLSFEQYSRTYVVGGIRTGRAPDQEMPVLVAIYYGADMVIPHVVLNVLLETSVVSLRDDTRLALDEAASTEDRGKVVALWKDALLRIRDSAWNILKPAQKNLEAVESRSIKKRKTSPLNDFISLIKSGIMRVWRWISRLGTLSSRQEGLKDIEMAFVKKDSVLADLLRNGKIDPIITGAIDTLQQAGYSIRYNPASGGFSACRIFSDETLLRGQVALIFSFANKFAASGILHEICGIMFLNDQKFETEPYRPLINDELVRHDIKMVRNMRGGKVLFRDYMQKPLPAVIIPIALVRDGIKDPVNDIPFSWVNAQENRDIPAYYLVSAREMAKFENFIRNVLHVLGPRFVAGDHQYYEGIKAVSRKEAWITRSCVTPSSMLIGLLSLAVIHQIYFSRSVFIFPVGFTTALLMYFPALLGILGFLLVVAFYGYHHLDRERGAVINEHLASLSKSSPLMITPSAEDVEIAAHCIPKEDFPRFKAEFCQELDPKVIDKVASAVWECEARKSMKGDSS